jgi:hypothetical protein
MALGRERKEVVENERDLMSVHRKQTEARTATHVVAKRTMVKKGGMTMKSQAMKSAVLAGGVVALLLFLASGPALAHKNNTSSAIGFSANPVTEGTPVTITATVTYTGTAGPGSETSHGTIPASGTPVVGDTVKIQELLLGGVGVPCGTPLCL